MNNTMCHSQFCWMSILYFFIWWFVASGLIFATWNHVVAMQMKVKKVKYWHALLVVASIAIFTIPHMKLKAKSFGCMKNCHSEVHHSDKELKASNNAGEYCPYTAQKSKHF